MKSIIESKNAPAPVGPYNQAVLVNGCLYVSGQIAIDPATGNLRLDDIETETRQVLHNLKSVLQAADMDMHDIVKCSVFVTDMHMYSRINAVYGEFFDDQTAPARELVEVANLPKFVNVEISAIAYKS
ncbi:UNVERIFIED_CONTAM: hypothetical protein GTU68_037177 [Idotea baltica]|nr:hypothetical protein [Idotea baltica]